MVDFFWGNPAIQMIDEFLSGRSWIMSILLAAVLFFFALFGYKVYKLSIAMLGALLGGFVGFWLGSFFSPILGLVLAVIFGGLLAWQMYRRPFKLLIGVVSVLTFIASLIGGVLLFFGKGGIFEGSSLMILMICAFVAAAVVALMFRLIFAGALILITSFGGALFGMVALLGRIPLPMMQIITLVLGLIGGVLCMLFQIANGLGIMKLSDLTLSRLTGKDKKDRD